MVVDGSSLGDTLADSGQSMASLSTDALSKRAAKGRPVLEN